MERILATPLIAVKGVGPKAVEKLARKGLTTLHDALSFLPLRHDDRSSPLFISQLKANEFSSFSGVVTAVEIKDYARRKVLEATVSDGTGRLTLKWFKGNFSWIKKSFPEGTEVSGAGTVKQFRGVKEIHHPDLEVTTKVEEDDPLGKVVPVYSEVEGLHSKALRKIMKAVVDAALPSLVDLIPECFRLKLAIPPMAEAYLRIHFPPEGGASLQKTIDEARRAIVLEEFFFLQLGLLLRSENQGLGTGIAFHPNFTLVKALLNSLPFEMTAAQRRVLGEIKRDMESPRPMMRLLQGDVGSGKTLVALISALMSAECGCQTAIMAPTEILAEQHFSTLRKMCAALPMEIAILTGSTPQVLRDEILSRLKAGEIHLIIGTHALIQDGVEFHRLGLAVVDEQHRFGVLQRATLVRKGENPDLLVMTATPIPRSLSMTVYGDLDLSVIDELPPGRTPITTKLVREKDCEKVYGFVREEAKKGRQAYLVYPLVEESEALELRDATTMFERFSKDIFPDLTVGLVHGKMRPAEKDATMSDFAAGKIQILVSTTVVEVGIDVPNATLMVIEHAERFGLSQLHQLRGRVGRGAHRSFCVMICGYAVSNDGWDRLMIMIKTSDGFRIAEEDLRIRGPGDFLGSRQSGLPDFRVGNILRDGPLLEKARELARIILKDDPALSSEKYRTLREALLDRWSGRLELAKIG